MTPDQLAEEISLAADGDPDKAGAILTRIILSDRSDGPAMTERKIAFAQHRNWRWFRGFSNPRTGVCMPAGLECVESEGSTENPRIITITGVTILGRHQRMHRLKFMTDGYPKLWGGGGP